MSDESAADVAAEGGAVPQHAEHQELEMRDFRDAAR
jgi:hypothetical protein